MAVIEESPVVSTTLRQAQRLVLRRLDAVRRALRMHLLVDGLSWVVAAVLIAVVATLILDRLVRFNRRRGWGCWPSLWRQFSMSSCSG